MKYCDKCGTKVSSTANFCEGCGKHLKGITSSIASITGFNYDVSQSSDERRVHCDFAGGDVIIVEGSSDEEIRLICPHASRFDGHGFYYIECKRQKTFLDLKTCGIFEGMRKFK